MKKPNIHIPNLFFGLVVMIALLGGSVIHLSNKLSTVPKKENTAKHNSSESNEVTIQNVTFEAVVPVVEMQVFQDLYVVIQHFVLDIPEVAFVEIRTERFQEKLFKTLFQFIISPNAP